MIRGTKVEQALTDHQVRHRNMVVEIDHSQGGSYRAPGNPIKFSETNEDSYSSPPLLGEHTDETLITLLGKSADDIEQLRSQGII